MKNKITVGVIGGGNMGRAMAISISKINDFGVIVSNPHIAKIKSLKKNGIAITADNLEIALKSQIIILAVKPNLIESVLKEIKPHLKSTQILTSVAAGITTSQIEKWSSQSRIVRAMPNTPVQINEGFTAWYSKNLNAKEKTLIKKIFASTGVEMALKTESEIVDIGTLTGCGPAYVFYFLEAMQIASEKFGFSKKDAKAMCLQTFLGAIKLAQNSKEDFVQLRENVTSKGGVTHAAITHMESKKVKKSFQEAVLKAKKRTIELRKG